jgi:GntR family transcriptional regulator, transcriptional repressor for pyruvate dehydrogenase complex
VGGRRLADQAYSGIVEFITVQHLKVGDRLPPEMRLAEMFGMSRAVIREALVRLTSDGITEARRGAGSYVKNRPSDRLIAYTSAPKLSVVLGTYEVRFVLESEAARLAATRRSSQDMVSIEEALDKLRTALLSGLPAHAEDMEIHRRILLAAANTGFLCAFNALSNEVDQVMRAGVEISRSRTPEEIQAMIREHETVVDAIRARDADGAALAMHWHLSQGRKRVIS